MSPSFGTFSTGCVLVRDQYTKRVLTHEDLLPSTVKRARQSGINYLLDRTLDCPRDVIVFFNECIAQAFGKVQISESALRAAEGIYSKKRLQALEDEWRESQPSIFMYTEILRKRPVPFQVSDISQGEIDALTYKTWVQQPSPSGENKNQDYINEAIEKQEWSATRQQIIRWLYKVGIAGLKLETNAPISWSNEGVTISPAEITDDTRVYVHKAFWRYLAINTLESEEQPHDT